MRDIANVNRTRADCLDRQVIQFLDRLRAAIEVHVAFDRPDFYGTPGQNQILRADRVHDVGRREPFRLKRRSIEVHLNLALLASVWIGKDSTLHSGQLHAHKVSREVVQLLLGQVFPGKRELKDGHRGGVVSDDERRSCSRRVGTECSLREG